MGPASPTVPTKALAECAFTTKRPPPPRHHLPARPPASRMKRKTPHCGGHTRSWRGRRWGSARTARATFRASRRGRERTGSFWRSYLTRTRTRSRDSRADLKRARRSHADRRRADRSRADRRMLYHTFHSPATSRRSANLGLWRCSHTSWADPTRGARRASPASRPTGGY